MARIVLLSPSPVRTFPSIFRATLVVDEVSQKHLEAEERGSRDWREWDTRAEVRECHSSGVPHQEPR